MAQITMSSNTMAANNTTSNTTSANITTAKYPTQKHYMTTNSPNKNGHISININSVEFEYNIVNCEINYSGTILNATPNFESYVTTIDFYDLAQLRQVVGPLNFLKLDQIYNFVGKRPNRPQSTKSPVPFLPFYATYTGDIYYSNEPIEQLVKRIDHVLAYLNVQFNKSGYYYYYITDANIESEICIYLTDEEDGYIIEFRNLNRREFNDKVWIFKNKWAVLMKFIKEEVPYPFYARSLESAIVLPPFVEFPKHDDPLDDEII
jgi:hypothetical protein